MARFALLLSLLCSLPVAAVETGPPGSGITDGIDTASVLEVGVPALFPMTPQNDPATCVDCEWHRVYLKAATVYRVQVAFPPLSSANDYWPTLSIWEFTGAGPVAVVVLATNQVAEREFTPTQSGYYYVAAGYDQPFGGLNHYDGNYNVFVSILDDFGEGTATNGRAGGLFPLPGAIEAVGDEDWFRIDLTAGQLYTIRVEGTADPNATLALPLVALVNASGGVVASGGTSGGAAQTSYTPSVSASFWIRVRGSGASIGSYFLETSGGDLPADPTTWAQLELGASAIDLIQNSNDEDWFEVFLVAGQTYQIDAVGSFTCSSCTLADPMVLLYDSSGLPLYQDLDSGVVENARIRLEAPHSGSYFIGVRNQQSGAGTFEVYLTSIAPPSTDDLPADASTGGIARSHQGIVAKLSDASDRDWFLTAQHVFHETFAYEVIGLDGGSFELSLIEAGLPAANVVIEHSGPVTRLSYTPSTTIFSDSFIEVSAAAGSAGGRYRLRELDGDIPDSRYSWALLPMNVPATSAIHRSGDLDWFGVALVGGASYTFRMEGSATGAGTLPCPRLMLRDLNGVALREDNVSDCESDGTAEFTWVPVESGSFFLEASRAAQANLARGTYRVTALPEPGLAPGLVAGLVALAAAKSRRHRAHRR